MFIKRDGKISADILLLKSSLDTGLCFLDTMNLDGETNLKEKLIPPGMKDYSPEEIANLTGFLICDKPNENLEKWECTLNYITNKEIKTNCSLKQFLCKGCTLKNTDYVIGIVVYTGHNTKIMKNAKTPPIKVSNVMKKMNTLLYSVFAFQILLCLCYSLAYTIWQNNLGYKFWYLALYEKDPLESNNYVKVFLKAKVGDFFLQFLTFLVSYSHLIPISLYVALEIVKLIQTYLIFYDNKMIDPETQQPATARTSDLIEELGQVEFIFSDKTGTLTKNEMQFRKCFINYKIYGNEGESNNIDSKQKYTINGDPTAHKILSVDKNESTGSISDKRVIEEFFTCCSVCHSAYVEMKKEERIFQSSSPDEVALIQGADQMGFEFMKRTSESIEIKNYNGEYYIYDLILELPFDSNRKRMSVVVKNKTSYILYTKGADSNMLCKIRITDDLLTQIKSTLDSFAQEGLRTLVMAKKILKENDVKEMQEKYNKITMSTDKDKEKLLLNLFEEIENELSYIGCSAIEDKLQEGVPETIELLMRANIKIWVLTGDKKVILNITI